MNVNSIFEAGGVNVPNPNYNESTKDSQPRFITVSDLDNIPTRNTSAMAGISYSSMATGDQGEIGKLDDYKKYLDYGIIPVRGMYNLDDQLVDAQSATEKWWNGLTQAVVSEVGIGTFKSVADLIDVISGSIFRSDNDYSNPVSTYLEQLQEEYRNNNPVYVDKDKNIGNGGLTDAGWWASNFPSIASTLTLLLPSIGLVKLGKALKVGKAVGYTRKALLNARGLEKIKAGEKLGLSGQIGRWANKSGTIATANRAFETGFSAAAMRTMENYQEARQTYNDMYEEASNALLNMSDEEYTNFLNNNKDLANNQSLNVNDRDSVTKYIANRSANRTFILDYGNTIFDIVQLAAIRNPLKLTKNLRQTASVRKAERLARERVGKTPEQIAELEAKKSISTKVYNFVGDHAADGKIIAAEATEGIEEAWNYVSQQEGMNYGRLMFDSENSRNPFSTRFKSYINAPELHDSAFWGLLGGVAFQAGGSTLNRVVSATELKIKDAIQNRKDKKKGVDSNKTKEREKLTWKNAFETTETKRRVAEINARESAFETLSGQLTAIQEGKNPFIKDSANPTQNKNIESDMEAEAARKQAIDEYIVGLAFRSIDSGNYNLLKSYLRDERVQQVLKEKGIIGDESSEYSIESLIDRMDKVEELYDDNIIAIDGMSSEIEDIPFEYIQIIARNNALAQIQQQRLDERLQGYELSAANNEKRFANNLNSSIDYKSAVSLVVAARQLGMLRAEEKDILSNSEYAKSLEGQSRLREIKNRIKTINEYIYSDNFATNGKSSGLSNKLARLLWANGVSTKAYLDERNQYKHDDNAKEYIDFLNTLSSRNIPALRELTDIDFEASDEDIQMLFGENEESTGMYDVLSQNLNEAFDVQNNIAKKAPNLDSDYQNIAALTFAKLIQQTNIANTTETITTRINELHNNMKEARKKAIAQSNTTIFDLAQKYGSSAISSYIFQNQTIDTLSNSDKKSLDAALEVLNLSSDSNQVLAQNLQMALMFAEVNAETKATIIKKEKSSSEDSISDQEIQELNNPSATPEKAITANETDQKQVQDNTNQEKKQLQKLKHTRLKIKPTIDNDIEVDFNVPDDEIGYNYVENEDGTISLSYPDNVPFPTNWAANSQLYDGYNSQTWKDGDKPVMYPVLEKDNNGNYHVKQKGVIDTQTVSSIPSKGEGVKSDTTSKKADSPANEKGKEVILPSATDEEIEQIEDVIQKEVNTLFRSRDKSKDSDIANTIDAITNSVLEKHKNDKYPDVAKKAVARSNKILKALATRRGLIKSAAETLLSSRTEMPNGKYDFSIEYKKAVVKMIEDYCKVNGIRQINGKYYINLEDALRQINTLFEDKAIADMLYGALNAYLKTQEAKEKFVITDNTDSSNFLDNVKKTSEQRRVERIGEAETQRVNVVSNIDSDPAVAKVFDSIENGDILDVQFNNGNIVLSKNGIIIGNLPAPLIDATTGRYYKYNEGWKTDVNKDGNGIVSDLKSFFEELLFSDSDAANSITDNIIEFSYSNPNDERKKELIVNIYNTLVESFKVIDLGLVSKSVSPEKVVNHLAKLWKYFDTRSETPGERKASIADSLDKWFEKMYNSYSTIEELSITDLKQLQIKVEKITSGELIRVITSDNRGNGLNYDKYTQVNEALANPNDAELGIVTQTAQLTTTTGKVIDHSNLSSIGNPTVVLHNKNGLNEYIVGISAKFNDTKLKGDAKQIMDAIRTELNYQIDKHIKDGNYEGLFNFIKELCYTTTKSGQVNGLGINTGLLRGLIFQKTNFGFNLFVSRNDRLGASISIHNNDRRSFNFKHNGEQNFAEGNKNLSLNDPNNAQIFKDLFKEIFDAASFNMAFSYLQSDIKGYDVQNGFATSSNHKFTIYIPNTADPSKVFLKTYDSFKDAVIKGGLIRVNTKVENGSNFRRKGINQAANQVLEVSVSRLTTSPVKRGEGTQSESNQSDTKAILTDDSITNKADALLKDVFTDEQLKSLNKLHLLPENIIFDENFNTKDDNGNWDDLNARAKFSTGETIVGNRWLDMFNEEGQFTGYKPGDYRRQAIRKLIHEQLHHKLYKCGRKEYTAKIEEIYNEFEESLKTASEKDKENISKYLIRPDENKIVGLEEFLVESLTSGELVDYLNRVETKFEKGELKNNLWQKILQLLDEIFGWTVKEGSLREKELYALQADLKNIREGIKQIDKQASKKEIKKRSKKSIKQQAKEIISSLFDDNQLDNTQSNEVPVTESKQDAAGNSDELSIDDIDLDALLGNVTNNNTETRGSSRTETVNDYTPEMQAIKDKAIADGTFMKTPNGSPTNLNERQWLQVRTKNFINWFGDWINDKENASKVVDENGEPLVVYHHRKTNITDFSKRTDNLFPAIYFSIKPYSWFGQYQVAAFLNIRNPIKATVEITTEMWEDSYKYYINKGYDGAIGVLEDLDPEEAHLEGEIREILAFTPNQIKSATSNTGKFSTTNDDIRYSSRTERPTEHPSVSAFVNTLPIDIQPKFIDMVASASIQTACK